MAHRRRGVGVGRTAGKPKFQKKADEMKAISYQSAIDTIEKLENKLSTFAKQHQREIQRDPAIRQRFLQMCGPLGIDPLMATKNKKSVWSQLFFFSSDDDHGHTNNKNKNNNNNNNTMSDFYYELAVKVAEICIASRSRNGGIMSLTEVQAKLSSKRTRFAYDTSSSSSSSSHYHHDNHNNNHNNPSYSQADIQMAISKLGQLGGGFRTIEIGSENNYDDDNDHKQQSKTKKKRNATSTSKTLMVVSVPTELNNDHMELLSLAKNIYIQGITIEQAVEATGWTHERTERSLQVLLSKGMAWMDHHQGTDYYWFPSIWQEQQQEQKQQQQQQQQDQ